MSKKGYVGVMTSTPIFSETEVLCQPGSNMPTYIGKYFDITNGPYSFGGASPNVSRWDAANLGINSSTATITLKAKQAYKRFRFHIDYVTETNYDKVTVKLNSTTLLNGASGNDIYRFDQAVNAGDIIVISYTKDSSQSASGETCWFGDPYVTTNTQTGTETKEVGRLLKKGYISPKGLGGVARKVIKGYVGGPGNVARMIFGSSMPSVADTNYQMCSAPTGVVSDLTCIDGVFYAGISMGNTYRSTDGKTWTAVLDKGLRSIIYVNGLYVAGAVNGLGFWYSTNGINWTQSNITQGIVRQIEYGNGVYVATADLGLYYSTDGKTWSQGNMPTEICYPVCFSKDKNIWVIGSNNKKGLFYSTDGINWTKGGISNSSFRRIIYVNGMFVATSLDNSFGMAYSTDGKTWTWLNIGNIGYAIYDVYHANGLWVAGSYESSGIYYSTDGKTWTQSNIIDCKVNSTGLQLINYCDGNWLLGSDSALYWSRDGKNWTKEKSFTDWVNGIATNGEIWVIGGDTGLYYSVLGQDPSEFTITFNANGGSVSPSTKQTVNGKVSSLPTPTRTNYTFQGWYTSTSGGTQLTTSTVHTQNTTYYARWQAVPQYVDITVTGTGYSFMSYTIVENLTASNPAYQSYVDNFTEDDFVGFTIVHKYPPLDTVVLPANRSFSINRPPVGNIDMEWWYDNSSKQLYLYITSGSGGSSTPDYSFVGSCYITKRIQI